MKGAQCAQCAQRYTVCKVCIVYTVCTKGAQSAQCAQRYTVCIVCIVYIVCTKGAQCAHRYTVCVVCTVCTMCTKGTQCAQCARRPPVSVHATSGWMCPAWMEQAEPNLTTPRADQSPWGAGARWVGLQALILGYRFLTVPECRHQSCCRSGGWRKKG